MDSFRTLKKHLVEEHPHIMRWVLWLIFYPALLVTMLVSWLIGRRWWDDVDDSIVLGAFPLPWLVPRLVKKGVTHVIDMCDESEGPTHMYRKHGLHLLHLPTLDFTSPSFSQVVTALRWIDNAPTNSRFFVHCKAGRGRSGTIAAAYLIAKFKKTPQEAQTMLNSVRPHVNQSLWKRPCLVKLHKQVESGEFVFANRCQESDGKTHSILRLDAKK